MTDNQDMELIKTFAKIVCDYCSWAESSFGTPHQEMLTARKFLAQLHLLTLTLPDLGCGENVKNATSIVTRNAYQHFKNMPINGYWDVFAPLSEADREPVFNSLADDLTDIYLDLKRGLLLYNQGHIIEAVWEWRFHFNAHWGTHLVGAQRAIHSYFS